ncbi:PepSY domain-containing protein [Nocardiopsis deserti]|uniref:PepSY domain-containing protein n=1 Tax=Nocardiopsis deserti TaxID=2605988 RepID=UPI00123C1D81|nr:hypothetical protein [Nocardiopsis deserti]
MQTKTIIILSSSVAAGLLAVGTVGYVVAGDPEQQVAPIELTGVTAGADSETGGNGRSQQSGPSTRSVDGLEQLVGELRAGDDTDDWSVSGVEVDFGPEEWLLTNPELEDFDGNGTVEPLLDELRGLEGTEVTLGVRYEADDDDDGDGDDEERDDADVFTVNGTAFRDTDGGPAPWQNTGEQSAADRETVSANAAAAVGEGATTVDVERQDEDGWDGWEAEVHGADGQEYDVILDAAGEAVDVRAED